MADLNIEIIVSGKVAKGKTTIAKVISDALTNAGIVNTVEDIDGDYEIFQEEKLNNLVNKKTSVVIKTKQLNREPQIN